MTTNQPTNIRHIQHNSQKTVLLSHLNHYAYITEEEPINAQNNSRKWYQRNSNRKRSISNSSIANGNWCKCIITNLNDKININDLPDTMKNKQQIHMHYHQMIINMKQNHRFQKIWLNYHKMIIVSIVHQMIM